MTAVEPGLGRLDPTSALPRGAAYMEALQDPTSAFADPDLSAATPVLNPLGLPRPVSGNFASVFRLESDDGRAWAVRCFVRWFDDMGRRYAAIDQHLRKFATANAADANAATADAATANAANAAGAPASTANPSGNATWRVGFEFQERGVHVDGDWFPIVKMDWAAGQPLLSYIEQHLWDAPALAYLATRFAALVDELRRSGVAHGDLQHGNILVAPGGDLRLIDYDGMFVPPLADLPGNELGHRNYQHPARQAGDFGLHLDNFASWVIYASLVGLSVDPLLWGRLDGGDECLLFRSHDFADPAHSEALAAFEATNDPVLIDLATRIRRYLALDLSAIPPLSPDQAPKPPLRDTTTDLTKQRRLMAALRDDGPTRAPVPSAPSGPAAAFVEDIRPRPHHQPGAAPAQVRFTHMGTMQALLAATFAVAVLATGLTVTGALAAAAGVVLLGLAAAGAIGGGRWLWQQSPEVADYRVREQAHADAQRALDEAKDNLERLQRERAGVDRGEEQAMARAGRAQEDQQQGRDAAVRQIDDELRVRLTALAAQEQELYRAEHTAVAAAIRERQRQVIENDLKTKPLTMFSGLDDRLIYALALDDVRTAADVVDVFIENEGKPSAEVAFLVRPDGRRIRASGLTTGSARQLMVWRRSLEARLSASLPTRLTDAETAVIKARFADQRAALDQAEQQARAEAATAAERVRAMPMADSRTLTEAARQAQRDAAARRVKLDQELNRARKAVAEAAWQVEDTAWELDAFRDLSFAAYVKAVFAQRVR